MRQQLGYLRGLGQDDAPPPVTTEASASTPAANAAPAAPDAAPATEPKMRRHGHGRRGGGMMMLPMLIAGVAVMIAVFALGKASH